MGVTSMKLFSNSSIQVGFALLSRLALLVIKSLSWEGGGFYPFSERLDVGYNIRIRDGELTFMLKLDKK